MACNTSFASNACNNIQLQLKNAALKHLKIETLKSQGKKTELVLGYSGFFLRGNAEQEGQRVVSHLMKCNDVDYSSKKTLLGYTLKIKTKSKR